MYISFTGHRDRRTTIDELDRIHQEYPDSIWVHGGAYDRPGFKGFDSQVERYAKEHGIETVIIRPDYAKYPNSPKYAPLARDEEIVNKGDYLFACYDEAHVNLDCNGRSGTKYTVEYARKVGKPVCILPALIE